MDKNKIKVLGFAGSLRRGSYNKALLRAAMDLVPEDTNIEIFDLEGIPPFNQDTEDDYNPRIIEKTRQYIRYFDRLVGTTTTQELHDKMLELYASRVNPGWAIWSSARAVKS